MDRVTLDDLIIDDEDSFREVSIYPRLKRALRASGHTFLVPRRGERTSWDRAVFLNLTYWQGEAGVDVLCENHIPADVVAHIAWHALASRTLRAVPASNTDKLFFGEAIASAFDLYLVGRLLTLAPQSEFITSQVPRMSEAAETAGLSARAFAGLLDRIAGDPVRAFEDLRSLLFDLCRALLVATNAGDAHQVFEQYAGHRFAPLVHHFELSNWILYARAYHDAGATGTTGATGATVSADSASGVDGVRALDAVLRSAPDALAWLDEIWCVGP